MNTDEIGELLSDYPGSYKIAVMVGGEGVLLGMSVGDLTVELARSEKRVRASDLGLDSDSMNSAVDVMRQLQSNPTNSLQKILWESIKDYAERGK